MYVRGAQAQPQSKTPNLCLCPGGFNSDSEDEAGTTTVVEGGLSVCSSCRGVRGGPYDDADANEATPQQSETPNAQKRGNPGSDPIAITR